MMKTIKLIITVCSICFVFFEPLCVSAGNMPPGQMPMQNREQMPLFEDGKAPGNMEPEGSEQLDQPAENMQQIPFERFERNLNNMQGIGQSPQPKTAKEIMLEYSSTIISLLALAIGFVFVIFYKRKRY